MNDFNKNRKTGFISLYRKFTNWEWYQDNTTKAVFIHCLLKANWKDRKWQGAVIKKGSFITSIANLSSDLGLSKWAIRRGLSNLEKTGYITLKPTNKYTLIIVDKYSFYQIESEKLTRNPDINPDINPDTTNNINNLIIKQEKEKEKEKEKTAVCPLPIMGGATASTKLEYESSDEVIRFRREFGLPLKPEDQDRYG